MILRKVIPSLVLCSCLCLSASPRDDAPDQLAPASRAAVVSTPDFDRTVVPITEIKYFGLGLGGDFGTGFCLDTACRFIGTNYHVAMLARPREIKGQKVVQLYLATGPDDEGATVNDGPSVSPMKYTLNRDLAIFELRLALPHHHGVAFSLDDLEVGQQVDIFTYPKENISPFRSLLRFQATFKGQTTDGLLAFDYRLAGDKAIHPGASGGIVVDSKTHRIVGILGGIPRNGEPIALAVPVQSLADFVSKAQPCLAQTIFPASKGISPVLPDLYPKFVAPPPTDALRHRPEEPVEVTVLRSKAQLLADSMRNFIAVQTFAWGSGNKAPAAVSAYEVRVLDGYQRFRAYPDGKKELQDVPFPPLNTVIVPGGEWSELPGMVGAELRLKIYQAADAIVYEQRMKVFQYRADPEDAVCRWKSNFDFGFFAINKIVTVGCYGEVWTDENTNILRMSEHYELPGRWKDYQAVITYGWLQQPNETARLVPLTISTQAQFDKKLYWCRGRFTDYQTFSSRVKMAAN